MKRPGLHRETVDGVKIPAVAPLGPHGREIGQRSFGGMHLRGMVKRQATPNPWIAPEDASEVAGVSPYPPGGAPGWTGPPPIRASTGGAPRPPLTRWGTVSPTIVPPNPAPSCPVPAPTFTLSLMPCAGRGVRHIGIARRRREGRIHGGCGSVGCGTRRSYRGAASSADRRWRPGCSGPSRPARSPPDRGPRAAAPEPPGTRSTRSRPRRSPRRPGSSVRPVDRPVVPIRRDRAGRARQVGRRRLPARRPLPARRRPSWCSTTPPAGRTSRRSSTCAPPSSGPTSRSPRGSSRRSCSTSSPSARRRSSGRPSSWRRCGSAGSTTRTWSWSTPGRPATTATSGPRSAASGSCGPWAASAPSRATTATPGRSRASIVVVDLNAMEVLRVEDYGVVPLPPEAGNWAGAVRPGGREPTSSRWRSSSPRGRASRSTATRSPGRSGRSASASRPARGWCCTRPLPRRRPRAADPLPGLDLRDGRPLRRPGREVLPQERLRHRRVRHRHAGQLAGAGLRLPRARSATSTPTSATAGAGPSRSRTPSACTRRTPASSGSTPTGGPTSRRSGGRGGWPSRCIATVGNYEYGFFWYLYQDGSIQCEVKLTGIMNTTALAPGETSAYGVGGRAAAERAVSSAHLRRPARPGRRRRRTTRSTR